MNVLVTGGAGFIGRHLVEMLIGFGYNVTALDDLSNGNSENLISGCDLVVGDIRDSSCVEHCVAGKDLVFHLAAFTSVPGSMEEPDTCFDINVEGTRTLLEKSSAAGVKRFIFSSTSAVYPDTPDTPRAESTPPVPKSPYAQSKLECEDLLRKYHEEKGLSYTALRYFNVYGPQQDPCSDYAAVIPVFMSAALEQRSLTIHGDGQQTRDFVYVSDVADANLRAAESDVCSTFNVGTSCAVSVIYLAKKIISLTGSGSDYVFSPARPADALSSTADISLIDSSLGWAPKWELEAGLAEAIGWYRSQKAALRR